MSSIRDVTLSCPDLTVEQCDRLLNLIAEHQRSEIGVIGEAIRMEYISFRMAVDLLQQGGPDEFEEAIGVPKDAVNLEAELRMGSRVFAAYLKMSEQPYHEVLRGRKVDNQIDTLLHASDFKVLSLFVPPVDPLWDYVAREHVRLAGTQMLIAIRRYELTEGNLPESLDIAAQEAGLDGFPADPYSGQPFGYKVIDDRPIVYSVGSDQKDDGGLVDWNDGQQPGDFILSTDD